jgi:hypothetical protein
MSSSSAKGSSRRQAWNIFDVKGIPMREKSADLLKIGVIAPVGFFFSSPIYRPRWRFPQMEGFNRTGHFIWKGHSARGFVAWTLPSAGTAESGGTLFEIGLEKKKSAFAMAPKPGPIGQDIYKDFGLLKVRDNSVIIKILSKRIGISFGRW